MVDAVRPTFVKEDPAAIAELNRINQNNSGQDLELAPRAIRPSAPRGGEVEEGKLTITHKTKLRKGTKLIVSLNDSGKLTTTTGGGEEGVARAHLPGVRRSPAWGERRGGASRSETRATTRPVDTFGACGRALGTRRSPVLVPLRP